MSDAPPAGWYELTLDSDGDTTKVLLSDELRHSDRLAVHGLENLVEEWASASHESRIGDGGWRGEVLVTAKHVDSGQEYKFDVSGEYDVTFSTDLRDFDSETDDDD